MLQSTWSRFFLIFSFLKSFPTPLDTVSWSPTTIDITAIFMFQNKPHGVVAKVQVCYIVVSEFEPLALLG